MVITYNLDGNYLGLSGKLTYDCCYTVYILYNSCVLQKTVIHRKLHSLLYMTTRLQYKQYKQYLKNQYGLYLILYKATDKVN